MDYAASCAATTDLAHRDALQIPPPALTAALVARQQIDPALVHLGPVKLGRHPMTEPVIVQPTPTNADGAAIVTELLGEGIAPLAVATARFEFREQRVFRGSGDAGHVIEKPDANEL